MGTLKSQKKHPFWHVAKSVVDWPAVYFLTCWLSALCVRGVVALYTEAVREKRLPLGHRSSDSALVWLKIFGSESSISVAHQRNTSGSVKPVNFVFCRKNIGEIQFSSFSLLLGEFGTIDEISYFLPSFK